MDAATADLLTKNLTKLDTLSPTQLAAIVAALKAYDDPASAEWRQFMVGRIEAKDWFGAGTGAVNIAAGQVKLKKCP
jgi:hypothetical protein